MLPITSKLLPFRARNLAYLAEVAALTRMATGVVRVMENRPSQQKDGQLSANEKRQALAERFFVEILGTAGYMAFLHLGQDLVDKAQARLRTMPIPKVSQFAPQDLKLRETIIKLGFEVGEFNTLIEKLYNPHKLDNAYSGLLYRVLYEDEIRENGKLISLPKANLANLQKTIIAELQKNSTAKSPEAIEKLQATAVKDFKVVLNNFKDLEKFASKNNIWAATGILTGVVMSATVGGTLTQWMNDRLVAPTAKKWLNRRYVGGQAKPAAHPAVSTTASLPSSGVAQTTNPTLTQNAAVNPFTFSSITAPLPPNPPPIAPVYLPNPKMQPPAAAFAANTLPRPYSTPLPNPMFGGRQ